ncbi:MAG TPA: translocation/assembly module TamB domain-containing protein [Bacillota bacterium]|nr:translocation/assembly module TamB domain-containing protein [Bacillota bacterium]
MKGIRYKKALIWMTVVLVTSVLLYNLPLFFLNEPLLTKQVRGKLNHYFQKNGFRLKVAKIRWIGGGRFEASQIALTEPQTGEVLVKAERLILGTDWTAFLKNLKNPEMVLREFEVIRPQLTLVHYSNQTWNFSPLFQKKGKRKVRMGMQIRIREGQVGLDDYKLGKHRFQNVSGKLDFRKYPLISWNFKGDADFGKALTWKSTGRLRTDQVSGLGEVRFVGLPLEKTMLLMPWRNPSFKVKTGIARGSLDFAWNKKTIMFQKVRAVLKDTVLKVPFLPDELQVASARTDFSPDVVQVYDSELYYKKTKVKLTGTLDPLKQSLDARLNSRGARLEDLLEMFPEIPQTVINGRTDLKLKITGLINKPVFNGEANINRTRVVSNKEVFNNVEGKLAIRKNNVRVHRLKALWHEAWVYGQGAIYNIYNPRLNLQVQGKGVVLSQFELVQMAGPDLTLCRTADFTGKFTGYWDNPLFTGDAHLEQLEFRKIPAKNLQIGFTWEPMALKVKVRTLESDVWQGRLTAAGQVIADDKRVSWNIAGKIKGLALNEVNLFPPGVELTGKTVSADAVLKGAWRYDMEFDPGTVMGVIKGQHLIYQNIVADEVAAVYSWSQGVFTVDSLLCRIGEGRIFGSLTLDRTRLTSKLNAENIRLNSLFDQRTIPANGIFEGSMNLEGELADLKGRFAGSFSGLSWNAQPIGNVTGNLEYRHKNQEIEIANLLLDNPSGDYQIGGKAFLGGKEPLLDIKVASDNLKLKGLLGYLPLDSKMQYDGLGRLTVEIRGPLKTPTFAGTIDLTDPLIAGIKMDSSTLVFRGDLNRIQLTQCEISNQDSHIFLAGSVERNKLDLNIGGTFNNLETFNLQYNGHRLKGQMSLEGRLEGSPEKPVLAAMVRGEKISFGEFDYPLMTANIRWIAPELEIYNTRLIGGDNSISASGKIYTSQPVRFDLGLDVDNFKIRELLQLAKLDKVNADGNFSGKMVVSGTLNDPQIRLDGGISAAHINAVPVSGELALFYAGNKLVVEKVGLLHDIGTFYATGVWEKDKALKLRGRLNQFPLATVNSLLKNPELKLAGTANADIVLEWSESLLQCDYQMTFDNLQVNEEQLGNCSLNGNLNEYGFVVDSGNLVVKNGNLGLSGFIPWPDELRKSFKLPGADANLKNRLDLRMTLKNAPVVLVNMFAVGYLVGGGECNGYLNIGGSLTKPEISGKMDFSNTQLELPDLPLLVNSIVASVSIENNRAIVHRAVGYVDKGRIDVTGNVDFKNFPLMNLNLDFEGSRIYFKNFFYDGFSDFNVKLAGEFNKAYLMGNLNLYSCKMGGLTLMGSKKGGKNDWNPQVDLMVKLGRKVRFRQVGVADVSVNGDVHVKGTLAQPTLGGEVTTSQGVVTFYSQTFKVNRGEAVFSYTQGFNPFVDIEASLMTPRAQIFLKLKGQVGTEIMPMLSSQPALPQKEIFALLNWSDLTGEQPLLVDEVVGKNMNMVADALFSDIFYQIRDRVGFDYFYLETDYRSNEYRINVGDYVTDKLFVSYTRALISEKDKEDKWNFDYHLTPKMAAGGSYSVSEGRSWRLSYTFQF